MDGLMIDKNVLVFVNDSFYHTFASRDLAAMDQLWARDSDVTCIHPGWAALHGRDQVMAGWRSIMETPASPGISPYNARAHVLGDSAFVVCYEKVPGGMLIATNVFVEEDGRLCLVHHQAAPCQDPPPEQEKTSENIQ
jgi:limonene-1,2-epoxide hydrolase